MLSEAFAEAMEVIASKAPSIPLPKGLTEVETPDWKLAVNSGREPVQWQGSELPGYTVGALHKEFLIIAMIGPDGGVIGGGMTEDQFIEDMRQSRK